MHPGPNQHQSCRICRRKVGEDFCHLELDKGFLDPTTKAWSVKDKWKNWILSKLNTSARPEMFLGDWERGGEWGQWGALNTLGTR